jgi:hypothetical protein
MLILSINLVLACKYIGQSKKKCFKSLKAAPHRQDGSDTIPTRHSNAMKQGETTPFFLKKMRPSTTQ